MEPQLCQMHAKSGLFRHKAAYVSGPAPEFDQPVPPHSVSHVHFPTEGLKHMPSLPEPYPAIPNRGHFCALDTEDRCSVPLPKGFELSELCVEGSREAA
jgi:hypothetical protein